LVKERGGFLEVSKNQVCAFCFLSSHIIWHIIGSKKLKGFWPEGSETWLD
jgi:hypothetical protein